MRIDVHHAHYYPPALSDLLERVTGTARERRGGMVRGFALHTRRKWSRSMRRNMRPGRVWLRDLLRSIAQRF